MQRVSNRRRFLELAAMGVATTVIAAACAPASVSSPTQAPAAAGSPAPTQPAAATATQAPSAAAPTPTSAPAPAAGATATPSGFGKFTAQPVTAPPGYTPATGKLEIFSWWTSGGEVEALNYLYGDFKALNPQCEIVNSAITGGTASGGNMKAVLQTRMMGGDPPESFQIHLGHELFDSYVVAGKMEPLDTLYADEGYDKVFPKMLIELASYQGKPYSVPCNIHRTNVLWYNTAMLKDIGAEPPTTWDELLAIAEKLKAKGVGTLGLAESSPGPSAQLFESILMGHSFLGPAGYRGLFTGETSWSDPKITDALNLLAKLIPYFNPDYLSVSWGDINDLMINRKVAMMVMGDWTPGVLWSKGFNDFGWADPPDGKGIYAFTSDSFGLPKGVKNRQAAINWLKVCGSKHGQEGFNFYKGSIPARTDADLSQYTDYHKWANKLWTDPKTEIVGSIVHGVAAKPSFNVDFQTAINVFVTKKDVTAAREALLKAAKDAGFKT